MTYLFANFLVSLPLGIQKTDTLQFIHLYKAPLPSKARLAIVTKKICALKTAYKLTVFWLIDVFAVQQLVNLSKDVFERRTSTGSGFFSFLDSGFAHFLGQLVSIIVKTLRNTNLGASRCFKMKKTSLPVDVRRSKTPLLKLPILQPLLRSISLCRHSPL